MELTHLIIPQSQFTISKAQVKSVKEYSSLSGMSASFATLQGAQHHTGHSSSLDGHPLHSHSLTLPMTYSSSEFTICKMHCSNSPTLLKQHLPNNDLHQLEGQGQQKHEMHEKEDWKLPTDPYTIGDIGDISPFLHCRPVKILALSQTPQ